MQSHHGTLYISLADGWFFFTDSAFLLCKIVLFGGENMKQHTSMWINILNLSLYVISSDSFMIAVCVLLLHKRDTVFCNHTTNGLSAQMWQFWVYSLAIIITLSLNIANSVNSKPPYQRNFSSGRMLTVLLKWSIIKMPCCNQFCLSSTLIPSLKNFDFS